MLLRPCNRYLLIEPLEEDELEESSILLPDDYKKQNPFGIALVISKAKDCNIDVCEGDTVVYSISMTENVALGGKESFLLLENYVLGIIHETN